MSRIGEIRKDTDDGELAIVEDIDVNDEGETMLEVTGSDDDKSDEDALGTMSEEDFVSEFDEHVLARKEVWRLVKDCTPHWVGTDVEIVATTLTTVAWRVVRKGPLMGPVQSEGESEKLERFLKRFRFMDYAWDKDAIAPYEATDADRAALKNPNDSDGPDLYETLASLGGVDVKKPITKAELIEGLTIAASMEKPTGELLESMREIGVVVDDSPPRKPEDVPRGDQRKAIRAAVELRRMVEVAKKETPDADTPEARTAKMKELVDRLDGGVPSIPTAPPSVPTAPPSAVGTPGNEIPWKRGQVRRGDILNIVKGGGPEERYPLSSGAVFTALRPRAADGGAPLWDVVLGDGLPPEGVTPPQVGFRTSWPNALLKRADSTEIKPLTWKVGERRRGKVFGVRTSDTIENGLDVEYTLTKPDPSPNYDWRVVSTDGGDYGVCEHWPSELIEKTEGAGQ